MMGRQRWDQGKLFYEFRLDDRIPQNHLLRRIDVFVTAALADLHKELEPYYSEIGRPSVDPELMIRMLLIGYCCQEVELHLAYRWFCKLDLEDEVPHHSTFSANRLGRFHEGDVLRHVFERVVWAAMAMGLVKGEGFAVDASVLEANASRYHGKAPAPAPNRIESRRLTRAPSPCHASTFVRTMRPLNPWLFGGAVHRPRQQWAMRGDNGRRCPALVVSLEALNPARGIVT